MKRICKHCLNSCKKSLPVECKDYRIEALNELIKERNALLVSQDNPKRIDELNKKIDYINFGIIY